NSLEVRVPFLDKDLVTFARSLPVEHKISGNQRKKVLQDAFENILPKELHHRSKKGFEVPVLHWLKNDLYSDLEATLFQSDFMIDQGLFNIKTIQKLEKKLFSKDPGDVHSILWSLYIFQKWYKKYFLNL
ncbi:MAG: asparagine synthase-related protein, partial [Bacteroidota bacterium]